ncbi:MAG: outer membrane beta-barrel protein [Bacteroidota bacterium]
MKHWVTKSLFTSLGILLLSTNVLFAQNTISGRVLNEQEQPLDYATVTLLQPTDSILQYFGVTNERGEYQIKAIKAGTYILQFSFVGMQTAYEQVTIPLSSGEKLGDKILQAAAMDEVIVEAELIPVRFKNDTLEFDVRAFKTRPGAAAEEVLRQLPGVEVDNAGNIKAEGEEVVKVLVDGKEFFDRDPKVATQNLPAKALSKVQVIDRKTEEAQFTGVDDGIREKTINLELKEDHKKGYFGELSLGLGTNENYKLEGNLYRFSAKTQSALLGKYNNINEFGFTNKDNQQFGRSNKGINETLAGGVNLSYNPNTQNRYFLSYLGNRRIKDLVETIHSENYLADFIYEQEQDIEQEDRDQPHKINFGVRHNFNKDQRLVFDGVVNVANSDIFTQNSTNSSVEDQLVNTLNSETNDAAEALSLWTRGTYIAKLKNNNQLKAELGFQYNDDADRLDWINNTRFFDPINEVLSQQFQANNQDQLNLYAEPSFLINLNPQWSISWGARLGLADNKLSRQEGILNSQAEFEELLIPSFGTQARTIAPSFILNRVGQKAQLNLNLRAVVNQFERLQSAMRIQQETYLFWTPELSYRNEYRSGRRINLGYSMDYNLPTIEQLLPAPNNIDPLNILQGNPSLDPERSHQAYATWTVFDQFSFTSFSLRLAGNYTTDKIQWAQQINEDLVKVTSPINVSSDANINLYADFSTPLRRLGLDLNVTLTENWNRSIVFINDQENNNTNLTHGLNLAFQNRKNDVLAFRLSAALNLTDSRFSIAEEQNGIFFNTSYNGDIRYTPSRKWNIAARANVINFNAQSFDEAVNVPLLSAEVSYFFLQAEQASITLSAFDILNQYTGLQRISTANFLQQRQWNTLTQYVMLTFDWRFR